MYLFILNNILNKPIDFIDFTYNLNIQNVAYTLCLNNTVLIQKERVTNFTFIITLSA